MCSFISWVDEVRKFCVHSCLLIGLVTHSFAASPQVEVRKTVQIEPNPPKNLKAAHRQELEKAARGLAARLPQRDSLHLSSPVEIHAMGEGPFLGVIPYQVKMGSFEQILFLKESVFYPHFSSRDIEYLDEEHHQVRIRKLRACPMKEALMMLSVTESLPTGWEQKISQIEDQTCESIQFREGSHPLDLGLYFVSLLANSASVRPMQKLSQLTQVRWVSETAKRAVMSATHLHPAGTQAGPMKGWERVSTYVQIDSATLKEALFFMSFDLKQGKPDSQSFEFRSDFLGDHPQIHE